ncbi:MAG: DUF3237 domain-containing protein [Alicyclobacillus sp.]|nr:DUF3237 domain-containing protein [Alicyclobacillus sp.]
MSIALELALEVQVLLGDAYHLAASNKGLRRIIPIVGGSFSGPRLRGTVLPGGADWNVQRLDGVREVWARYTLQTDDGAYIMVTNSGIVRDNPDGTRYARTTPQFEVSDKTYEWLQQSLFVGTLERLPDATPGVQLRFYRVV